MAELLAEKAMLKRKQALDAAAENLRLDKEIAKAEAREKVYEEPVKLEKNISVSKAKEEQSLESVKEQKKMLNVTSIESNVKIFSPNICSQSTKNTLVHTDIVSIVVIEYIEHT